MVLLINLIGCAWSGLNVKCEKKSAATIAVCGLNGEEYVPEGKTLKSAYLRALKKCHAQYVLIPPGTPSEEVERKINSSDGLLLIGGGDIDPQYYGSVKHSETRVVDPSRDITDFLAFDLAQRRGIPILGICRGCQVINVARGGTLFQHLPVITSQTHKVNGQDAVHDVICESQCPMAPWPKRFETNSAHHQAIDKVGQGLIVLARSSDNVIEACWDPRYKYLLAVQWHPERIIDQPIHGQIFTNFITACQK